MHLTDENIRIASPHDLVAALRELKGRVARGELRQFKPTDAPFALDDIQSISEDGPWPDYIEAYFEDPRSRSRYKLSVETYHGAGGTWERT